VVRRAGIPVESLYLVGRAPDVLLRVDVDFTDPAAPTARVVRHLPLPGAPTEVVVIPRESGSALLAISCSGANAVALYDENNPGSLATLVSDVGEQPYGLAVESLTAGTAEAARLYVTNFGDGRVAIIDIPDLLRPFNAKLVAHLGPSQRCLTFPGEGPCPEDIQ
jgi:hypothetical protein